MNTYLSSSQQALKESFLKFAGVEISPYAGKLETGERSLKDVFAQLAHKGFMGINVPQEYGGQGHGLLEAALLVEAISQHIPGLAWALAAQIGFVEGIKKYGSDVQKSRYLPVLARGEGFATVALSEVNAGTDFEAVETTVTTGSPAALSGAKTMVVNAELATLYLVLAKEPGDPRRLRVVLSEKADGNGTAVGQPHKLMGLQAVPVASVEFKNKQLTDTANLGGSDAARPVIMHVLDVVKVILAAAAVGLLERCKQNALAHARTRQQFGSNIGQFQGVQWKLADLQAELFGAELQVYRAAWSCQAEPGEFPTHAAMAKMFATRAARAHSGEALQVMGAAGLASEEMDRLLRDAKTLEIVGGTSEFQKILIADYLQV